MSYEINPVAERTIMVWMKINERLREEERARELRRSRFGANASVERLPDFRREFFQF